MAGQVKHVQIFSRAVPDARMLKVLLKLPRRNTDSLIGAIASELQSEGIELVDSTCFLQDSLPKSGTSRVANRRNRNEKTSSTVWRSLAKSRVSTWAKRSSYVARRAWRSKRWKVLTKRSDAGFAVNGRLTVVKGESRSGHAFRRAGGWCADD